tara:strand:- start:520 stop:693 length:174 start_codon:yes stop_codon:yes gene_type:complete
VELTKFEKSIVLMGIDWSKAAKLKAFNDIKAESPSIAQRIKSLDTWTRRMDRRFRRN